MSAGTRRSGRDHMKRQEVLAAFDTPNSGRRQRLPRLLSRYGLRVQRSVFRPQATSTEVERLWTALERVIVPEEDLLLVVQVKPGSWRLAGTGQVVEVPLTLVV